MKVKGIELFKMIADGKVNQNTRVSVDNYIHLKKQIVWVIRRKRWNKQWLIISKEKALLWCIDMEKKYDWGDSSDEWRRKKIY